MRNLLAALLTFAPFVPAQAAPYCDPLIDPTALIASKARAAANPLADPHLRSALPRLKEFGLDTNAGLVVIRAHTDAHGWTHAHLQQTAYGLKVKGGGLISHSSPQGVFSDTPHFVKGMARPAPKLTGADAVARVSNDPRRTQPLVVAPTATLMYLPRYVTVLKTTGAPAPAPSADPGAEYPMPEEVGLDDVTRRLVGVDLVYEVDTTEGDCTTRSYASKRWVVDALAGTVLSVFSRDENATGNGSGFNVGSRQFNTTYDNGCYKMRDASRQFTTEDEDQSSGGAVNCDTNNTWGDGAHFQGDFIAGIANRQTAMVDAHFGGTVYWDLLSNVFQQQGPDDDYYSVNLFVHDGILWDNAKYHGGSGNVSFGDGSPPFDNRTRIDCAGHELGHAWNDHNTDMHGDVGGLNESLGDIFGEWTDAYLNSGNFASHSSTIGATTDIDYINQCSGRDLRKPSWPYWYNGIQETGDTHRAAGPSNRAFAYLAVGAPSFMGHKAYSFKLPWGMTGLGLQKAARIYFLAMQNYMDADEGYFGLKPAMYEAAKQIYGAGSSEVNAVINAYAGVHLGTTASGYPTKPATLAESEPNHTKATAQVLAFPSLPAGAPSPSPKKVHLSGSAGATNDVYRFAVPNGGKLRVAYTGKGQPLDLVTVTIGDASTDASPTTVVGPNSTQLTKSCSTSGGCTFFVTVHTLSVVVNSPYLLDADLEP